MRALLSSCLLVAGVATPELALAQSDVTCGVQHDRWSVEDSAEDFFILAAQEGESLAASRYEAAAERDAADAADLHRLAAQASERAMADLAAAARILEENGQLRSAQSTRALKDVHRERADENWRRIEALGLPAQPGTSRRGFACEEVAEGDAAARRQRAEGYLEIADDIMQDSGPPYGDELIERWSQQVTLGADALVDAGCLAGPEGLEDLLSAGRCLLAVAQRQEVESRSADLFVKAASALRAIARLRAEREAVAPPASVAFCAGWPPHPSLRQWSFSG